VEDALRYDYIVVGGGSSGCAAAYRLVKGHGARVLLIEAGPGDSDRFIHMPAGFTRFLTRPCDYLTPHRSPPQPSLGGRSVVVEQANVLGGGSSVNAMTYTRGTRSDYDRWNEALGGNAGWGWDDLLPHFVNQESNQRLGPPNHGVDGPLKVSDMHHPPSEISRSFILTLQKLGFGYRDDINCGEEGGVTYIQSTTYRGRRCSAAEAFIRPIRSDPRLTIRLGARALRVLLDGKRAIGIEYSVQGRVERAYARDETILTAGSFVTPKILMLSGIGAADTLRQHGIDVASDVPGVGRNLQDHNDVRVPVHTTGNFGYSGEDRGWRMLRNGLQYLLFNSGPVCSTGSEVTAFFKPDGKGEPTIQLYCMPVLYAPPGHRGPMPNGATLIANLVRPRSRGSVSIRSANPADPPIVNPNWLSHPDDVKELREGLKFLGVVANSEPFSRKLVSEKVPLQNASDAELDEYCRQNTATNWHPVGTCRMGNDLDPGAVVDTKLRVRGIDGLRVFDGSVMPDIVSANTNAPIMAIADRGVALMMGS
jgi:choline dehydrogenase